jgi:hypothetical protein
MCFRFAPHSYTLIRRSTLVLDNGIPRNLGCCFWEAENANRNPGEDALRITQEAAGLKGHAQLMVQG